MAPKKGMSSDERKKKQRESMKKLREARRNDPLLREEEKKKERERYHKRKSEGKIKSIGQMSARNQRLQRKEWRKRSKKSYDSKKQQKILEATLELNSPPLSPQLPNEEPNIDRRRESGRKKRRRNLHKLKKRIVDLEEKLKRVARKKDKYRMRLQRLEKNKKETPRKKVKKLLKGQRVDRNIRKKLLFGEVVKAQLKENFQKLKCQKSKKTFWKNISGKEIKKYKLTKDIIEITSFSYVGRRSTISKRRHKQRIEIVKQSVTNFLQKDENSRATAGKKECITRKKIKKQKRYLNNSMKKLYKKFLNEHPHIKLSYALFCRFRPFWILPASADKRDTCLCILHTNVDYMIKKLKHLQLIKECSPEDLKNSLCCAKTERTMACFNRQCDCKSRKIEAIREFNTDENKIKFERWVRKIEEVEIKGKKKKCTKTVKETVTTTEEGLLNTLNLNKTMPAFLKHIRNISHQYRALDIVKTNLQENDVLIHCDFSENYECKYKEEVQAAHFGGSKSQLSLHTVVLYYKSGKELKSQSLCSVSECLRHDASSVCAHLTPVIKYLKTEKPNLNVVHFLSDGPTSQYRNRKMFYLIANYLPKILNAKVIKWHYTEQGHGKGAPDGVGGCLKRHADRLVGIGKDITNANSFIAELQAHCPSIKMFILTRESIQSIDKVLPKDLVPFGGTLKIHEIVFTNTNSELYARELTCTTCLEKVKCSHYGLGTISVKREALPIPEACCSTSSPPIADTRICLVGEACSDPVLLQAAQGFGIPVVASEDGSEWQTTTPPNTIFVMDEFSGPIYENLHRLGHRLLGTTAVKELNLRNEALPNNTRPLYSLAMWGLVICFTGFRKKEELARLISLIHNMGGSIRRDMVSKVTHLVAHKCGGDKYQYALTFRVPVMAASWVHNAWAMRAQVGFSASDLNNNLDHKLKPFQGARVCFHGFPEEEQKHMAEVLIANGGIHTDIEDPACSHLVLDSAVTFDLIKAGALMPQSRFSLCFPQDFPTDPHTSTPRGDVENIKSKRNMDSNENVTLMDISPVHERRESLTSVNIDINTLFNMDYQNDTISSVVEEKVLKSPMMSNKVKSPSSTITSNLSPIKESSPLHSTPRTTEKSDLVKKELTFSDSEDMPSPRLNGKRRRTMSPTELGYRKCKKSPKDNFKTLSSIRRSLRVKTFNSLSRWISSSDVAGKLPPSSPMSKKPLKAQDNTPKNPLQDDLLHQSPPLRSWGVSTVEEDSHRMQLVVDESTVISVPPQAPTQTHMVKAEWFWASVQNEGCVVEKDYLFEDYLESLVSPNRREIDSNTPITVSGRARKRKRLQDAVSRLVSGSGVTPVVSKRRSSVSDAGLLSVSGSFLDCTPSPGGHHTDTEVESVSGDSPRKVLSPRHQVFLELVQTESNYVNILSTIMTLFKTPLEEMCETDGQLLNPTELKIIFGHLPPIYQTHCQMLEQLKWAATHWTEDVSIGNIFLKFAPDLVKAYPPFVNFFENTKEMLNKCDLSKPRFHAFLKICQTKPECGRQSLQELLIRPVQRLPSISLLLNDILKHTAKNNQDHSALETALSSIREVMTHINEDKRKTEGQMVMFDIFNDIDNCPPHLVSSHRSFITRCDMIELTDGLSGRGDSLAFFLFSDIVEVCKKRSKAFNSLKSPRDSSSTAKLSNGKPFKHVRMMPLSHIKRVIDIKETDDCHKVFALMCKSNQELKEKLYSFTIAEEETDKNVFLKTLCRQMANTVCRPDAENFLASLDPQQLDIETSDVGLGTLGKAFKIAARTRMKVGRAFSFNKTPNKLKRAMSTMMSPFGSTSSLTPASQLAQMRLASCNNLNELGSTTTSKGSPPAPQYVAPMSVQPTRRNKHASLSVASLRRL